MYVCIEYYDDDSSNKFIKEEQVRIDYKDIWNLDCTLAKIIHPALLLLKEKKHGSPFVDNEDVPEDLHSTIAPEDQFGDTDEMFHDRWAWVLEEMIWAFGQLVIDDWEAQYISKEDWNGWRNHSKRMQNGFRLFGKYYTSLWD